MRIGIHTSIAGSLDNAARKAAELGANTFQIFSASPRMWRERPPGAEEVKRMREERERFDLTPLVIHDCYLINLAAADETLRRKSIAAYRGEIERALAIGADYLVAHPGNAKGQTIEQGIEHIARSMVEAARGLEGDSLMLLLENTAGSGSAVGSRFAELARIRELVADRIGFDIGYCLDTAHCLAAGYDVATQAGLRGTLREAGTLLGLERVRVIHANDSKTPLASRVDRHEHIAKGISGKKASGASFAIRSCGESRSSSKRRSTSRATTATTSTSSRN